MPTDICRRDGFVVRFIVMKIVFPLLNPLCVYFWPNGFLRTAAKSASDVLRAAFDTKTLGQYPKDVYLNGSDPWPTGKEARNDENRLALWKDSVVFAGLVDGETVLENWR